MLIGARNPMVYQFTRGGGGQVSPGFKTESLTKAWANPSTAIVHMIHSG